MTTHDLQVMSKQTLTAPLAVLWPLYDNFYFYLWMPSLPGCLGSHCLFVSHDKTLFCLVVVGDWRLLTSAWCLNHFLVFSSLTQSLTLGSSLTSSFAFRHIIIINDFAHTCNCYYRLRQQRTASRSISCEAVMQLSQCSSCICYYSV